MKIDIYRIKVTFELLKTANNLKYCLLSELAKELGVKKTELMQFIIDNDKLVITSNIYKYKNSIYGKVKDKNLGLGILDVFLSAIDNYETEEWLENQIKTKSKYIYLRPADNYGTIEGYYADIDTEESSKNKEYLWRNTKEKLNQLKELGVLSEKTFFIGGYGDCSSYKKDYAISEEELKEIDKHGWEYNF